MFRKFRQEYSSQMRANKYFQAATIEYLDSGKIKTKGIVNKTFKLEQFGEALQSIKDKSAIKAAIVFD